jgi:hypothetical protein
MVKISNHVVASKEKGGWAVKKSGSIKASKSFELKEDAVKYARELSRKEETVLYIHKKNGLIQDRNSYGKDSVPAKVLLHG